MVDPVSGSGAVPPRNIVNQSQNVEKSQDRRDAQSSLRSNVDEVSISEEALSLQQAERAAGQTRKLLENSERALGIVTDDID